VFQTVASSPRARVIEIESAVPESGYRDGEDAMGTRSQASAANVITTTAFSAARHRREDAQLVRAGGVASTESRLSAMGRRARRVMIEAAAGTTNIAAAVIAATVENEPRVADTTGYLFFSNRNPLMRAYRGGRKRHTSSTG
jgi:hypothetical protein